MDTNTESQLPIMFQSSDIVLDSLLCGKWLKFQSHTQTDSMYTKTDRQLDRQTDTRR